MPKMRPVRETEGGGGRGRAQQRQGRKTERTTGEKELCREAKGVGGRKREGAVVTHMAFFSLWETNGGGGGRRWRAQGGEEDTGG